LSAMADESAISPHPRSRGQQIVSQQETSMTKKHFFTASAIALSMAISGTAYAEIDVDANGNQLANASGQNADDSSNISTTGAIAEDSYNGGNTATKTDSSTDNDTYTSTKTDSSTTTKTDTDTKNLASFNTLNNTKTDTDTKNLASFNTLNNTKTDTDTTTKNEDSFNADSSTHTKNEDSFNSDSSTTTKNEDSFNTDSSVTTNIVADQELKGVIVNLGVKKIVDAGDTGVDTGNNTVSGSAFAAYAGILNAAWNTGINSNAQAATNISAQGNVSFGSVGAAPAGTTAP
jgi:hypothetical protein